MSFQSCKAHFETSRILSLHSFCPQSGRLATETKMKAVTGVSARFLEETRFVEAPERGRSTYVAMAMKTHRKGVKETCVNQMRRDRAERPQIGASCSFRTSSVRRLYNRGPHCRMDRTRPDKAGQPVSQARFHIISYLYIAFYNLLKILTESN
jgi:hypothetical protein